MMALALWMAAAGCVAVDGDRILARDLAPAGEVFARMAPETETAYAPVPGVLRPFGTAELARLAERYGATGVGPGDVRPVCVERSTVTLTPDVLRVALEAAVADAEAKIEILDWSRFPVPPGEVEFRRGGLGAAPGRAVPVVWRGAVKYGAGRRFSIWARVRIEVTAARVTARENLPAGQPVRAAQLAVDKVEQFPFAARPLDTIAQVAGRAPRRTIPAGAAIFPGMLETPAEIHAGEAVTVHVTSGEARIAFEGRAGATGRRGENIPVRNPATGKSFRARVEEKGRVTVALNPDGAPPGEKTNAP